MREQDDEPPRKAEVWSCEWPSEDFMVNTCIKDEFDAYVRNAELEDFLQDKCPQYYQLTDSFVRSVKYNCTSNSPSVLFDIYDTSYTMDLEDFTTACKLPEWGNINDPHKSEFRDFLASITMGESRDIAQVTIGSIHFPAIHYFALFIGRCINGKDAACHMCVPDLCVLKSDVLGSKGYNLGAIVARRLKNIVEREIYLEEFMQPVWLIFLV